ncbi:hypothetical protein [Rhizorhapis suberifaciens]|uniref:Uncharacterized protein n=1 Tax=Rhizorhapis suberifaciens TaxID=13656 RepID=A0A840HZT8_9SPHN|nr:hypothetical protein [Rhizorhapis suberifaciens]MBB4642926.1 hypothetical protein [Rhizorhapis suberifaciens]
MQENRQFSLAKIETVAHQDELCLEATLKAIHSIRLCPGTIFHWASKMLNAITDIKSTTIIAEIRRFRRLTGIPRAASRWWFTASCRNSIRMENKIAFCEIRPAGPKRPADGKVKSAAYAGA